MLETLKKNDKILGLKEYIAGNVCEQMQDDVELSVMMLMKYLDEKFRKTKYERIDDLNEMFFEMKNEEKDPAKFFEKAETLAKKIKDERISDNMNFFAMCIMMKQGKNNGLLSDID